MDDALGRPVSLHLGGEERLYVGTTRGLFPSVRAVSGPSPGVAGPVVNIVEDRDGVVWAATWGRGLYRVAKGKAEQWTSADGLPDDFVHSLFEDNEGNLWIGSRAGLSRWRSGPIVPYGPPEGLSAQFISTVAGGAGDAIWVGTWEAACISCGRACSNAKICPAETLRT